MGKLLGFNLTVANNETNMENNTENNNINSTELKSVANVFQEMLNKSINKQKSNIEQKKTSESGLGNEVSLGDITMDGEDNEVDIDQESSVQNSQAATVAATMLSSTDFTIQQKFLLARATQLVNDQIAQYDNSQGQTKSSSSSTGSNPNLNCQSQGIFTIVDACMSNNKTNYINNVKNNAETYLSKINEENTTVSQKNINETLNEMKLILESSDITSAYNKFYAGNLVIKGKKNKFRVKQITKTVNQLKSDLKQAMENNAVYASDSDTTNTSTDSTTNTGSTSMKNTQSQEDTLKITDSSSIIMIVVGIVIVIAIGFVIYKYYTKSGGSKISSVIGSTLTLLKNPNTTLTISETNELKNNPKKLAELLACKKRIEKNGGLNKCLTNLFKDRRVIEYVIKNKQYFKELESF